MAGAGLEGDTQRKSMRYQGYPEKLEREDNVTPAPPGTSPHTPRPSLLRQI